MALVEPGTAEPEGYLAEKAKGNLLVLQPMGKFQANIRIGTLDANAAQGIERKINQITGRM